MVKRNIGDNSAGILNEHFIAGLIRDQVRRLLPETIMQLTAQRSLTAMGHQGTTERLRVTVPEAARIIGVSRTRLYKHIKSGAIRVTKDGGRTLFTMSDLRKLVPQTEPMHST